MSYALEHYNEFERLESQSQIPQYSIENELLYLKSDRPLERILDAGCGTGLASRYLAKLYPNALITAGDISELRIQQAKKTASSSRIQFKQIDVTQNIFSNEYDLIICRYLLQHLKNPEQAIANLSLALKKQGQIFVVDFDGIFFNLYTRNTRLNLFLNQIQRDIPVDPYVGKKIPQMLKDVGLKNIRFDIIATYFKGDDLEKEYHNNVQRCQQCRELFSSILGSKDLADEFINLYLSESKIPENVLYYNKFIITGTK